MEEPVMEEASPLLVAPRKPAKRRSTLLTVTPFILANEFCERLAYYGLCTNLVNYFTKVMNTNAADAAIQVSVWSGVCYTTPLLGAYLADSMWGRYKTIMIFSSVYVMGMLLMVMSAAVPGLTPPKHVPADTMQYLVLYAGLYTVALGTGGIKPCVSAFGADQFDENHPRDKREKESFFNWFYFAINVGSLLASTIIVYIQEKVSWSVGFGIPMLAMLCAITCFICGSRYYKHVTPNGSPIARVLAVVWAALVNKYKKARGSQAPALDSVSVTGDSEDGPLLSGYLKHDGVEGTPTRESNWLDNAVQPVQRSRSLKWLEEAITPEEMAARPSSLAPRRGKSFSVQQVEEVKMVLRLLPVFFTTVGYWAVYAQMSTMFVEQGGEMDTMVRLGSWSFDIPSASMSSLDTITIIILIPMYDSVIEPGIRRLLGYRMTLLQKIGWGLVLSILSMLAAAWVESVRLGMYHAVPGAPLRPTILWQTFQYALVGASEVMASVGQLEFFYDQAPDIMRSFAMALQLFSCAMGSYASGFLVSLAQGVSQMLGQDWLPDNLNEGRLDLFFLFIAGIMCINMVFFVWVAMTFELKHVPHKQSAAHDTAAAGGHNAGLPPLPPQATPSRTPPLPPLPRPTPAMPVQIAGRGGAHAGSVESEDEGSEIGQADQVYSRSLAYVPESPALPGPFR